MTDQQIIQGLINRDEHITKNFFFVQCKPLFYSIIKKVFDNKKVEYDELVNELYLYLMEDDAAKLRGFQFRCSVYNWLKILSSRFFVRLREQGKVIDDESQDYLYLENGLVMENSVNHSEKEDLERLIGFMPNEQYASVIKRLIIDDIEPERLAKEMHITKANLYNIKSRAIQQLTQVALKDIYHYGK